METKNIQKANRVLYLVIVAVLCVTAVIIGITAAANRGGKTPVGTGAVTTTGGTTVTEPPVTAPVLNVLPEFIAPATGVVAKAHDVSLPVYSLTMNDWRIHTGIDIACTLGDEVYAAADGEIVAIASDPMMGTTISIRHAGDGVTFYKNLSAVIPQEITVGARVTEGQVIGAVGDSAMIEGADEPHLHFELQVNAVPVDPLDYISAESREASLTVEDEYES